MSKDASEMVTLQVYGQGAWHDEVFVVGNDAGLLALERSCAHARKHGRDIACVFVSDGEGYTICVMRRPLAEIVTLEEPYTEDIGRDRSRGVRPAEMWKEQDAESTSGQVGWR